MLRALILATFAAALLAAPAPAATMSGFWMPSKQIACAYIPKDDDIPEQLRCDMFFLNDRAMLLQTTGKARKIRITDTIADPKNPVLAYGKRWRRGPFRCTSRRTGLTCRHRANGHGFFISRERQRVF